ncbi:PASTA domain-containing protein [Actinomadura sp. 9N407]|uniref:PASTA domain-containing protein n=1 Tax=Actinomadura sp. 9N407 TaxID=3375154 RepID=UPI0037AFBD36
MYPPPPRRSGVPVPAVAAVGVTCLLLGSLFGCVAGVGIAPPPEPRPPAAASPSAPSASIPSASTPNLSDIPEPRPTATASASTPSTPAPRPAKITVPDVVGENHQAAQNRMQAAGLFRLAEEDATGQGRALLWDANWQVVRQSPRAGTRVAPDTIITLYSQKTAD